MADNTNNTQRFIMLVGIPGSGKTAWAKEYVKENSDTVIHSSDSIREELGDINDQSNNKLVFQILHDRVKKDLQNGNSVIYDATNLNRKKRISFLREIENINCEKICVLFAVPFEICCARNFSRERYVPEEVMSRMYKSFQTPWYNEGFDHIWIEWNCDDKDVEPYDLVKEIDRLYKVPHDNPHHKLTIGEHMCKAFTFINDFSPDSDLAFAALLHDIGKYYCKAFDKEDLSVAHYYNHENVGAYLSLFYLKDYTTTNKSLLYISLLVNLHMRPLLAYRKSEKAEEKDRKLFGNQIINDVLILHKADINAN